MYSLLLLSAFCTGSCFDGRCVVGILIVVVFIVAVSYGNEAFGHSTRKYFQRPSNRIAEVKTSGQKFENIFGKVLQSFSCLDGKKKYRVIIKASE